MLLTKRKLVKTCAAVAFAPRPDDAGTQEEPISTSDVTDRVVQHKLWWATLTVPEKIENAALISFLDPDRMLRIAWCESKYGTHPNTYNGKSGYYGIFQFSMSTWHSTVQRMFADKVGGGDFRASHPNDDDANIFVACWLAVNDGYRHWGCK